MKNHPLLIIAFAIIVFVASNTFYTVSEAERAVQLRFREVVVDNVKPGLHVKIPFVDQVMRFDGRLQAAYVLEGDYLTREKKLLLVDSYAMWRIKDVKQFYTATGGINAKAQSRLIPRVNESLRNEFGKRTVYEVVAGQRDELMVEILKNVNEAAQDELGIEVVDIRVKKIDLPDTVSQNVYNRMSAERKEDAQELRSEGKELAETIRANAEKQQRIILADAYQRAQNTRGEGDAIAASTYAKAYNQDAEFFKFHRSLEAYRKTFAGNGNIMVVDPKSEFFDHMNNTSKAIQN